MITKIINLYPYSSSSNKSQIERYTAYLMTIYLPLFFIVRFMKEIV